MGGVASLVHTVCACSVTPGAVDTTLQYHSIYHHITHIQLKMVLLSEESGNEAKPVLMVFSHVDA